MGLLWQRSGACDTSKIPHQVECVGLHFVYVYARLRPFLILGASSPSVSPGLSVGTSLGLGLGRLYRGTNAQSSLNAGVQGRCGTNVGTLTAQK